MSNMIPGEGLPDDKLVRETAQAVEKLRSFQDDSVDPKLVQFAHFLAERMGSETIVPAGFGMVVVLATHDLQNGTNGWTGEPINNSLVGLGESEYLRLFSQSRELARQSFDTEFAEAYTEHLRRAGILGREEPTPEEQTIDESIMTHEISDIDTAYTDIVCSARDMLTELDWSAFNIPIEDVYKIFEATFGITLRQAPYRLPLTFLNSEETRDGFILNQLPDSFKKQTRLGNYYLAMTMETIPAEYATVTRDHLFLKSQELVAGLLARDRAEEVMLAQGGDSFDTPLARASIRLINFIKSHPDLLRDGESMPPELEQLP